MQRLAVFALAAIAASTLATRPASAQGDPRPLKEQLVGTWTFVSSTIRLADGSPLWGDRPKGVTIFTADGHFSSHVMRADRPKFKSNNRGQGTADEHKAAVIGAISSFGTYTVDEAGKSYTLRYVGSSYPNLEGIVQTRPFTISGDEMRVTNPAPTVGGPPSQLLYRRAR